MKLYYLGYAGLKSSYREKGLLLSLVSSVSNYSGEWFLTPLPYLEGSLVHWGKWINSLIFFKINIVSLGYLLIFSMFIVLGFVCLFWSLQLTCCFYPNMFSLLANFFNFSFNWKFVAHFEVIWHATLWK